MTPIRVSGKNFLRLPGLAGVLRIRQLHTRAAQYLLVGKLCRQFLLETLM